MVNSISHDLLVYIIGYTDGIPQTSILLGISIGSQNTGIIQLSRQATNHGFQTLEAHSVAIISLCVDYFPTRLLILPIDPGLVLFFDE